MPTFKVKFINTNPYSVTIKYGDAPDKIPYNSSTLDANKTAEQNISQGKHVFADKNPSTKRGNYLGEVKQNNQTFTITAID